MRPLSDPQIEEVKIDKCRTTEETSQYFLRTLGECASLKTFEYTCPNDTRF